MQPELIIRLFSFRLVRDLRRLPYRRSHARLLYLRRLSSSQRSAMTTLIGIVLNAKERALLVQALGCYLQHVTRQFPTDEIAARECIELARRLRNARRTDQ
jgi:hypothetical protein